MNIETLSVYVCGRVCVCENFIYKRIFGGSFFYSLNPLFCACFNTTSIQWRLSKNVTYPTGGGRSVLVV